MLFPRLPLFSSRIRWLRQDKPENCVQTVVAMALGVEPAVVEREAGKAGRMTVEETLSLLSRFGIFCRPIAASLAANFWPAFYRQGGGRKLRGLGFQLSHRPDTPGHAYFLVGSHMYDPATGSTTALNEDSIRQLDWLVLFPEEIHHNDRLATFRRAMERAS